MAADKSGKPKIPGSFSATSILQFLGAIAAFLAAYVLPLNFPEFEQHSARILYFVGGVLLLASALNTFCGQQITRFFHHIGMRSRFLLPREGIVYLGIMLMLAVAALLGHSNMLLLVFGMMAGPFILNGWIVISMLRAVRVSRQLPPFVSAGEPFSVRMTLRNDKHFLSSRLIEIRDLISGHGVRQEGSLTFVRVPPRSGRSGFYNVRILRRGIYQFGPVRISSRFPLGIGERGISASTSGRLHVHPATGHLMPDWLQRERELSETTSRVQSRVGVFDDEFHRIREYRAGDHPRSVHWRSTAKRGELMVKEYDQQRDSDLIVLLDLPEIPEFTAEQCELAVCLTATICSEQTRGGGSRSYRLMIAGDENADIRSITAGGFRETAMNALSVCSRSLKADLRRMLLQAVQSGGAGAERFLLITPRVNFALQIVDELAQETDGHSAGVLRSMTIIKAAAAEMRRIFSPPDLIDSPELNLPTPQGSQSRPAHTAKGDLNGSQ